MLYNCYEFSTQEIMDWSRDNYFLFRYAPATSRRRNSVTDWILDFKDNKDEALWVAEDHVDAVLRRQGQYLLGGEALVYLVTIPSHEAHVANIAGERLCRLLAEKFPWVVHLPCALERMVTVQKSSSAPPGMRPTRQSHYDSIRYVGPAKCAKTIVMFDDVYTMGSTSAACRDRIRETTNCRRVLGLFLGKTG